ncbi:hypothetical protein IU510_21130 [Nocardia cyriacigeorgica]|uniref:hypothetical protein n=1 Tax=Nocardia TaxID=1817 RepID=UPI001895B506|nr:MULTISPECIES: hypothetical protein [Nocardia]MBF6100565.1 hypothetical protein [Nocardia cyriacigeorgica]
MTTVLAFTGPIAAATLLACGTETPAGGGEQTGIVTDIHAAPTGLRWQRFQGVDLPVTDQGPHHSDGPVVTGFDRSPAGAAIAAAHASVRVSIATDGQWPQIGARMLAPGAGRDAWAVARAQISITAPITSGAPRLLGYVITRYTPETSEVDLYSRHPDNSVTRHHTTVLWQYDDWRLVLPALTSTSVPVVAVVEALPPELIAFNES